MCEIRDINSTYFCADPKDSNMLQPKTAKIALLIGVLAVVGILITRL